jgi:hypothetical protein
MRDEEEGLGCDGGASGITGVEIDELGDTNPCSGTVAGVVAVTGAAGLPASLSFTSVSTWSSIHTTGSNSLRTPQHRWLLKCLHSLLPIADAAASPLW